MKIKIPTDFATKIKSPTDSAMNIKSPTDAAMKTKSPTDSKVTMGPIAQRADACRAGWNLHLGRCRHLGEGGASPRQEAAETAPATSVGADASATRRRTREKGQGAARRFGVPREIDRSAVGWAQLACERA
jgi:hypothetical protein